ncbi:MAG: DUF983 domain-containing protein [Planctomycetaceae bacterium]|jgi:uncharacterized protein (DUF983 family)
MSRPPTSLLVGRALRLTCPRCGEAPMFTGLFRTHEYCPACHLKFEREPGYFLGSIYLNYGITTLVSTATWIVLRFGYGFPSRNILLGLVIFCVVWPTFFFRYARALWLALDLRFDERLFHTRERSPKVPKEMP